jgi:hypothetical protein
MIITRWTPPQAALNSCPAIGRTSYFDVRPKHTLRNLVMSPVIRQNFDEVPLIDFSQVTTDPDAYYKQLKFAMEDVGFGVSACVLVPALY